MNPQFLSPYHERDILLSAASKSLQKTLFYFQIFGRQLPLKEGRIRGQVSGRTLRPQPAHPEGRAGSQKVSRPPRVRQGHQEETRHLPGSRSGSRSGSVALDHPRA